MIVALRDADDPQAVGRKAATLGRLLRAGFDVPPGFVVPVGTGSAAAVEDDLLEAYRALGAGAVAVRSSATTEDGPDESAAGRYDSFLGVEGEDDLPARVDDCLRSQYGARAAGAGGAMAVLVQRQVDADVAGVVATVDPLTGAPPAVVEASWGLGEAVVGGWVEPDRFLVADGVVAGRAIGAKAVRSERITGGTHSVPVPVDDRSRPCLDDGDVLRVAHLAARVARLLGGPQDVEWALAGGWLLLLQARPLTGLSGRVQHDEPADPAAAVLLRGTPASRGRARGVARVVTDPAGGGELRTGEVLVCRTTDPSWTPLLAVASAVVTETGGVLAHAAIVARERGIPAVVGAAGACARLAGAPEVVVDGSAGTVGSAGGADVDPSATGASTL